MAQIGLVVLGIFLVGGSGDLSFLIHFRDVSFNRMVLPGQKITVFPKKNIFALAS